MKFFAPEWNIEIDLKSVGTPVTFQWRKLFRAVWKRFREFWSFWQSLGALGSAWECSEEFGRVRENLGVWESMGELYGLFMRVLKQLGEFSSFWESVGALGKVWKSFGEF